MDSQLPPPHAITSASGVTWLNEEGMIIAIAASQDIHTLEDAKETTAINQQLSAGRRRPLLLDISKVKTMSREARTYYAGPEPQKAITAVAILSKSAVGTLVGNFFIRLTKPSTPTRMFTEYEEARTWLLQYMEHSYSPLQEESNR